MKDWLIKLKSLLWALAVILAYFLGNLDGKLAAYQRAEPVLTSLEQENNACEDVLTSTLERLFDHEQ